MIASPAIAAGVHALFEYAAIALGVWLYRRALRTANASTLIAGGARPESAEGRFCPESGKPTGLLAPGTFAVLVGLLLGAAIGNKAVFFIERPDIWRALLAGEGVWPGQSIVGGLLGGLIGVEIAKWLTGQTRSTGDAMVGPLCAGIALGRVGCFLAGLHDDTYGLPTTLPWGVDLGDGVPRHPTALYEMVFIALLWVAVRASRTALSTVFGLSFKLFLSAYLVWRLLIDGLKPVRVEYPLGLSGIQWVCVVALLIYLPVVFRALWRWRAERRSVARAAACHPPTRKRSTPC